MKIRFTPIVIGGVVSEWEGKEVFDKGSTIFFGDTLRDYSKEAIIKRFKAIQEDRELQRKLTEIVEI